MERDFLHEINLDLYQPLQSSVTGRFASYIQSRPPLWRLSYTVFTLTRSPLWNLFAPTANGPLSEMASLLPLNLAYSTCYVCNLSSLTRNLISEYISQRNTKYSRSIDLWATLSVWTSLPLQVGCTDQRLSSTSSDIAVKASWKPDVLVSFFFS